MPDGPRSSRRTQPLCVQTVIRRGVWSACNHSRSFHGQDENGCWVTGCPCSQWLSPNRAGTVVTFSDPPS